MTVFLSLRTHIVNTQNQLVGDFFAVFNPPRVTDLARSAIMASDEVVKLIDKARAYKETLKSCFMVNRKIVNTAIGCDVREALSAHPVHVLNASFTQRVVFAESAAQGQGRAIHAFLLLDPSPG